MAEREGESPEERRERSESLELRRRGLELEELEAKKADRARAEEENELAKTREAGEKSAKEAKEAIEGGKKKKEKFFERLKGEDKGNIWLFLIFVITLLDMFYIPGLGDRYSGFTFTWWNLSLDFVGIIVTSNLFLTFLLVIFLIRFIRKDYSFLPLLFIFLGISYLGKYFGYTFDFGSYYTYTIIGLIVIALIALGYFKKELSIFTSENAAVLIFTFVYSFFLLNSGWVFQPKALIHFAFITAFGLTFIKSHEDSEDRWYYLTVIILLVDFFGYNLLRNLYSFRLVPFLFAFVVWYIHDKTQNKWATITAVLIALIIGIAAINDARTDGGFTNWGWVSAEKPLSITARWTSVTKIITTYIQRQIEFATGGLYRSQVELNQYAPLGVFFERLRAAQPRFYDDEPVTLWATISTRTLSDPVIVNFDCYRWNGNTRTGIKADDVINPKQPFSVGTYEEKDVECTFNNKLAAGTTTVSFAATYNFETSAYQKLYFIDKERLRAMRREEIDPLKQYGINDLKIDDTQDQGPATVYTNGPVELAVRIQKLIAVSNEKDIYPVLDILLQNRNKISDKNGNPVGEWQGVIKKVSELVVVLPVGLSIEKNNCHPVPFEEIGKDKVNEYCAESCTQVCVKSCENFNYDDAKKKDCLDKCPDPQKSDTRKKCDAQCLGLFKGDTQGEQYHGYRLDIKKLNEVDTKNDYRDIDRFKTFGCRLTADNTVLDNVPITTKYIRLKARYDYFLEKKYDVTVEKSLIPYIPASSEEAIDSALGKVEEGYAQLEDVPVSANSLKALVRLESGGRHCCAESGRNNARTCKPSDDISCPAERVLTSFDGSSIGIMQINSKCDGCAQRNKNYETKVCASDQNIYNRDCNIKVGLEILKNYYKSYANDGIKEDTLNKYCSTKWEYGGKNLHRLYLGYRRFDAVLRAYNGWGCNVDKIKTKCSNYCGSKDTCINNCISGTVFYVDKVKDIAKQIESGRLPTTDALDELPSMEEFEESATPAKP